MGIFGKSELDKEAARLQIEAEAYTRDSQQLMDDSKRLLDRQFAQAEQYDALLGRWESQARRFDAILEMWERSPGIQAAEQGDGDQTPTAEDQ